MITVPEYIIIKAIKSALAYLRTDYEAQSDKTKSYLHLVLNGIGIERYDFMQQGVAVFIQEIDNPRYLDVDLLWNVQHDIFPNISINMPTEQIQSGGNGIGTDEGYMNNIVDTSVTPNTTRKVFTRRYQAVYGVNIFSDNSNEVVLIYHTLRALLTSLIPSLSMAGLENIQFGGSDLQLAPLQANQPPVFMRTITLSLQYDTHAPSIYPLKIPINLSVTGTPVLS